MTKVITMKWVADTTTPRQLHCEIHQEAFTSLISGVPDSVGFYLYVWENNKGIADELQDTFEAAIDAAFRRYNVPEDAWQRVE